jgi:hypothetical protein
MKMTQKIYKKNIESLEIISINGGSLKRKTDAALSSNEVALSSNEVALSSSEVALSSSEVALSSSEVALSFLFDKL